MRYFFTYSYAEKLLRKSDSGAHERIFPNLKTNEVFEFRYQPTLILLHLRVAQKLSTLLKKVIEAAIF